MPGHEGSHVILRVPSSMSEPMITRSLSSHDGGFELEWPSNSTIDSLLGSSTTEVPWKYICWWTSRWPRNLEIFMWVNTSIKIHYTTYENNSVRKGNILRNFHEIILDFRYWENALKTSEVASQISSINIFKWQSHKSNQIIYLF